jgi:hypothetical protein
MRGALSGTFATSGRLSFGFDAAVHRITNFQHVRGDTRTRLLGSVSLSYRFRREGALP